ncbi:hypothetical protein [Streptomyces sp. NPDC003943]
MGNESLSAVKEDGIAIEWKVNNTSAPNVAGATDVRVIEAGAYRFVAFKGDPPAKS